MCRCFSRLLSVYGDTWGDGWNGATLVIGDSTAVFGLETGAEGSDLASCAVEGCTDANADNYNADANVDDGSCVYLLVQGCTDASACNLIQLQKKIMDHVNTLLKDLTVMVTVYQVIY